MYDVSESAHVCRVEVCLQLYRSNGAFGEDQVRLNGAQRMQGAQERNAILRSAGSGGADYEAGAVRSIRSHAPALVSASQVAANLCIRARVLIV